MDSNYISGLSNELFMPITGNMRQRYIFIANDNFEFATSFNNNRSTAKSVRV